MGRSVSYPNEAQEIAFAMFEGEDQFDWEAEVDMLKEAAQSLWPSFEDCNDWIGREDHAILENDLCFFGISEYCGSVAIWLCPKEFDDWYAEDARMPQLAERWINQISTKFHETFGTMRKIGTGSNGIALYQMKENEGVFEPGQGMIL
jgi:hypothetical protein